jgi:hypothetical protein
MEASFEFRAQKLINYAVAFYPALAPKGLRNYFDPKVGSAGGSGGAFPLDRMSMACM